uniref:Uncharacterized protein n=1 Tax=Physcomitrium patens TaxID=3218 RepID=A0A2K1JW29_PHYPA|nr:hypothetical protein PHYPA_015506 [Physcomitrium patens]
MPCITSLTELTLMLHLKHHVHAHAHNYLFDAHAHNYLFDAHAFDSSLVGFFQMLVQ